MISVVKCTGSLPALIGNALLPRVEFRQPFAERFHAPVAAPLTRKARKSMPTPIRRQRICQTTTSGRWCVPAQT